MSARHTLAIALLALVAAGAVTATPAAADCQSTSDPRVVIKVAPYGGGRSGEPANQLGVFLGALRGNYDMLKEDLKPYVSTAPFLQRFSLSLDDQEVMTGDQITSDRASAIWRNVPQTLQVFYGVIFSTQGQFTIHSSIYIGNVEPPLFRMALPLQGLEYGRANDSHSMLIYYALALEAKKLGCPRDVVIHLLSRTNEIATTLLNRQLGEDERNRVTGLKQSIEALAATLR